MFTFRRNQCSSSIGIGVQHGPEYAIDQGYAPNSINLTLAGLRGITHTAFNLGHIDENTLLRIKSVKNAKGSSRRQGRAVSTGDIQKLITTAKATKSPTRAKRDEAILAIGFGAGLRCAEICNLELSDFDSKTGLLEVRQGKGQQYRQIFLSEEASDTVTNWITLRGNQSGMQPHQSWQRSSRLNNPARYYPLLKGPAATRQCR